MSNREKPPFPSVIEARFEFLFDKWSQQVRVHKAHFRLMLGGHSSFTARVDHFPLLEAVDPCLLG